MRHRSKWRKRSDDSTIGINNTSSLVNTTSSTHPSTTFTIHNNNNNVLSNLITNTSRLLHSKSTYFYNGWGRIVPTFCILTLLVGLYGFINPAANLDNTKVYAEEGITPLADSNSVIGTRASNNASLTITPEVSGSIDAKVGETAYSNNAVKLSGDNIKSYSLMISYTNDSTALKNNSTTTEDGAANSIITGANNTTGNNMVDNTWGYSWSDNTSASSSTLTYKTMPNSANPATIKSAASGALIDNELDVSGKLAFAVKFGDKAVAGHYTTNVLLSLAVQPAEVVKTLSSITNMQEMTSAICNASTENETKQLKDTRDNKLYWVTKLKDGNCWMTQNLAYNGGGTSRGTNCSGWTNDNTEAQYCSPGHTDGDHASRGNYYSWAAAMNSNTSATGQVQGICPDGWHLPTSNTTAKGSFGGLTTAYGAANNAAGSTIMRGSPMYFQYSGNANSGGIDNVGSNGYYWSSTPYGSNDAYNLSLASSGASPSNYFNRYLGFSVRCLTKTSSDDLWEPASFTL